MKRKWILAGLGTLLVAAGLIFAYLMASKEHTQEAEREKPVASESRVKREANGEVSIQLDVDAQKRIGLQMAMLAATQFRPEIKAYGRVLDPATLSAGVADLFSARAVAEASQKELARSKTLAEQNNASTRALQAAQAAASRDSAQAESARARFVVAWGKVIADREDSTKFVESLASGESALVRVDLLAGDVLASPPKSARLFAVSDESNPVEAQFVSVAPAIDPQSQGQGFFFLVTTNRPPFSPGASVTAYVPQPGEPLTGVEIPRDAVVRFNGRAWIYLQTSEQTFARREIGLDHPIANGWFVTRGIRPNDRIVTDGAQLLFSEEQKYQIQMGD
jgi:hypothetical protein